jgi:hypothetical protein
MTARRAGQLPLALIIPADVDRLGIIEIVAGRDDFGGCLDR